MLLLVVLLTSFVNGHSSCVGVCYYYCVTILVLTRNKVNSVNTVATVLSIAVYAIGRGSATYLSDRVRPKAGQQIKEYVSLAHIKVKLRRVL